MLLKQQKKRLLLAACAGLSALLLGATISITKNSRQNAPAGQPTTGSSQLDKRLSDLVSVPPKERIAQLESLANQTSALNQSRIRYLLATDLIQQGQGNAAIAQLQDLEKAYPLLGAYVLRQRARAYTLNQDIAKAKETWQALLKQYPDQPVAAEALYELGQADPAFWDEAMSRFPSHPRTLDAVRSRLGKNAKQPKLLLHLARYGFSSPGIVSVLNKLVSLQAESALTPEDWEAIAFAYWENQAYGKAAKAYAKAPRTALNVYRSARGLQLDDYTPEAIAIYQQLVQQFPTAPEASLALMRLAKLHRNQPQLALTYLDQIVANFPDQAPAALLEKADVLDQANSGKTAVQVRQSILEHYPKSEAAAEVRWQYAQRLAKNGDLKMALKWIEPIATENPTSEVAPRALFWGGKWALYLGDTRQATGFFSRVLGQYPESYFAWRSAYHLGLNVGDFQTVRQLSPQVVQPTERAPLPAGSPALQELHQLGQSWDAWATWQVEFKNPRQPSIAEQFTDGVMRLSVGDNLDGIFMVSNLRDRETPSDKTQYQALRQQPAYWQALYPFPFMPTIAAWSQQRQLNPLLVAALIRQESRFEPAIRSSVGATGLMQVMPDTGAWIAEKIGLKQPYQLENPEDNIMLGTWYLDYTHEEYGGHSLLAVASYNAGPGNVADWVNRFSLNDPETFVNSIPFNETQGYVTAVFENYWNYLRLYNPETQTIVNHYTTIAKRQQKQ